MLMLNDKTKKIRLTNLFKNDNQQTAKEKQIKIYKVIWLN